MTKPNKQIEQALHEVLPNYPVDFAYLYGSRAKGTFHKESDFDIAVAFSKEVSRDQADELVFGDLLLDLAAKLSLPAEKIDLKNFSALPLPVRFRVIRDGRLIYLKDIARQRLMVLDTIASYHDEQPFFTKAAEEYFKREATS